ncbi:MAG: RluA family pseudouridine synthase [Deltaproteobacteria bacterium]|nr:RluA family pseudouridine synthase [Deltaproteobacteria bacterium]
MSRLCTPRMPAAPRTLEVTPEHAGARLDAFLADGLRVSRAEARRLLERGAVEVDARAVGLADKGAPLAAGQRVAVQRFAGRAHAEPIAQPELALPVLARGAGWLAVAKPAGMPVHPLDPGETGTALNFVAAKFPEIVGVGEAGLRSGVVHRLDVDTSGALLFATEQGRWEQLRGGFRAHRVEKVYRAIVHGGLSGSGELALPLAVAQHRPARVRVVAAGDPRSRHTRMTWRALERLRDATLVEARPATGFLHQIRASFAHLGHPLVGDSAYGAPASPHAKRHLLHAAYVAYRDVEARCPDAEDFAAALEAFAP